MYAKIIALFALFAVAFAAPKPEPSPQAVVYSEPALGFVSPYAAYSPYASLVSPYAAAAPAVLPYSAYNAYPYFFKK